MLKAKKQTTLEPKELTLEEKIASKKYSIKHQIERSQEYDIQYYNEQILDNAISTLASIQNEVKEQLNRFVYLKEKVQSKEITRLEDNLISNLLSKLLWLSANKFTNLETGIRYTNELTLLKGRIQLYEKFQEIQNLEKELEQQNKENGNFIK